MSVGDQVYICADNSGWMGPTPVVKLDTYVIEVVDSGMIKTDSMNGVDRIGTKEDALPSEKTKHQHTDTSEFFPLGTVTSEDE